MTILVTGAAGFVGCKIVEYLHEFNSSIQLIGIDNLSRIGSEFNIDILEKNKCQFYKGDISKPEDINLLPRVDWIIDCAAEPSVLAGLKHGSLELINNNLTSTFYLLEKCKRDNAGFVLLSTSRVYSINELNSITLIEKADKFEIQQSEEFPIGFSMNGVSEKFSTSSPISLYGATKLSSEILALEYHYSFGFPVWINRCGVIAGPGQFGKIDQGIISYWIYQYLLEKPLSFFGYGGRGLQSRDIIHPYDVFSIIQQQIFQPNPIAPKVINIGGGIKNTLSLAQLNSFCKNKIDFNKKIASVSENRPLDIPYYTTDYSIANQFWNWTPTISAHEILDQILSYGQNHLNHISRIS